jgi:hypothetical protein
MHGPQQGIWVPLPDRQQSTSKIITVILTLTQKKEGKMSLGEAFQRIFPYYTQKRSDVLKI